jgi:hypothetical protein
MFPNLPDLRPILAFAGIGVLFLIYHTIDWIFWIIMHVRFQ